MNIPAVFVLQIAYSLFMAMKTLIYIEKVRVLFKGLWLFFYVRSAAGHRLLLDLKENMSKNGDFVVTKMHKK